MERQKIVDKGPKTLELFMHGGYDLQQVYQQYATPDEEYAVVKKIAHHFNRLSNVHLNHFKFRKIQQANGETFNEYVNRVRIGAKLCKFEANEDAECVSQIIQSYNSLCPCTTLQYQAGPF
jgi:hypothetical protein